MSNALLTVDEITRRALLILHQKMTFISSINRQYDDSFANEGAKIGDTLRIRLPNQYTVRTGAAINVQDTVESKVDLTVATQRGVDTSFSTKDLTMDMDDFAHRILDPAMSVLAAVIEADALQTMTLDVFNLVDSDGAAIDFLDMLNGRKILNENLAPQDNSRTALLSNAHSAILVDALKGLFQDSSSIAEQYTDGVMGRTAGFTFAESSHVADHTTGTGSKGDTTYNIDGTTESGSSITVDGGTTTFLKGDIITLAGVNAVHSETKVSTGVLQQFVITADSGTSATSLAVSPSLVVSGAKQNVSGFPTDNGVVAKIGAGNGELLNSTLVYHKDAFTFATADLIMPDGVDFASRQVFDGISMRIVRQYDINNDTIPARIDVLSGFKTIRPQLACRIHAT